MINIADAINALHPENSFVLRDNDYTQIEWVNAPEKPATLEEVNAKLAELQAAEPMRQLREQRDQLLSATDWWCVSDRTATAEQLAYRQALRDLPSTATPALDEDGQLTGVEWPTKPE